METKRIVTSEEELRTLILVGVTGTFLDNIVNPWPNSNEMCWATGVWPENLKVPFHNKQGELVTSADNFAQSIEKWVASGNYNYQVEE